MVCDHELAKLPYESMQIEGAAYEFILYIVNDNEILLRLINLSMHGYYDLDWTRFFTLSPVKNTRGHHMKLYNKYSRLQVRENFFTQRVINMWNTLP